MKWKSSGVPLILLIFISIITSGCKTTKATKTAPAVTHKWTFPLNWIGHYKGQLRIHTLDSDTTLVPMQLIIENVNAEGYFPWTLVYGDDDIRPYGLEAINAEKGHYRINEYNSILLDGYVRGNHFITRFSLDNSDLTVDYEKTADGINVSFYVTEVKSQNQSGGEVMGKDSIPLVDSYPVVVFQKAILKKKE